MLVNNETFGFLNIGTGKITYTPASGNVYPGGGTSQIVPPNWWGIEYTNNANTYMPVVPTIAAFTDCHTAGSSAVIFTASTGAFGCNSISGGAGGTTFDLVGSGTNITAAMMVGSGGSIGVTGTGTIAATSVPFSGVTPGTNTASTAFSINPASALGGTAADFSVLGAPSETDTAAVVNFDTASGSTQNSLRVGINGASQLQVCSTGQTVVGSVVACSGLGAPNSMKFVSQAAGSAVQLERQWQSSTAFTATLNQWNSATAAGTGFSFLQAFSGVTSTDTTSGGGAKVFEILGNGSIDVGTWNSTPVGSQFGGTGQNFNSSTGILSFASGVASVGTSIGAATATSLLASGTVDGEAPVTITTGATATLGGTYNSGYTYNQEATASAAVTYTLPTPAAGRQYCVKNSNNGTAADTGALEFLVANTGTQSIIYNGTQSASGFIVSGGQAGDAACAVGISATQWEAYAQVGSWTLH
jgi:hypothetical protein